MAVPFITRSEMAKIDSLMVNHFGIETTMMMEHAGRNAAQMARNMLKTLKGRYITCLIGKGNNGGDAAVAARFLHSWGADVTIAVASHPDELKVLTKRHLAALRSMFVMPLYQTKAAVIAKNIIKTDLIIDGLLGYNIQGNPKAFYAGLIDMANSSGRRILSIDMPSGLDADTGNPYNPCIKAHTTLTLTLPKKGLKNRQYTGKLYLADIGIPPELYELIGLDTVNIFRKKEIIEVKYK